MTDSEKLGSHLAIDILVSQFTHRHTPTLQLSQMCATKAKRETGCVEAKGVTIIQSH